MYVLDLVARLAPAGYEIQTDVLAKSNGYDFGRRQDQTEEGDRLCVRLIDSGRKAEPGYVFPGMVAMVWFPIYGGLGKVRAEIKKWVRETVKNYETHGRWLAGEGLIRYMEIENSSF